MKASRHLLLKRGSLIQFVLIKLLLNLGLFNFHNLPDTRHKAQEAAAEEEVREEEEEEEEK